MVDERVTDGTRLGELLASELDNRTDTGLARIEVRNVDEAATATPAGTEAYEIWIDTDPIATVSLYPDQVELRFPAPEAPVLELADSVGLTGSKIPENDSVVVWVDDGAEVKRVVEVFVGLL